MDSDAFHLGSGSSLGFEEADVPVKVRRGNFRQFSRWMDRQLGELVARWAHAAAPCASQSGGCRDRKGRDSTGRAV